MRYILPLLIALSLLGYEFYKYYKRTLRLKKKKQFNRDTKFIRKVDKIVNKYDSLAKMKEKYAIKLGVINSNKTRINRAIVLWYTIVSIIGSIVFGLLISTIFTMWYVVVILTTLTLYMSLYGGTVYLSMKLNKVYSQFPIALQQFTDEYITTKSIKNALNKSYIKMPREIGLVFEKLARELSSGYEFKEPIMDFADSLSYVWGYAFAELMLMSYSGAGDISEDLLFLNELVNEEIQADEEDKTEQAGNKMVFIILNSVTLVVFVLNTILNPVAKELYFYTSLGNSLVMFWIGVIVLGITASIVADHI